MPPTPTSIMTCSAVAAPAAAPSRASATPAERRVVADEQGQPRVGGERAEVHRVPAQRGGLDDPAVLHGRGDGHPDGLTRRPWRVWTRRTAWAIGPIHLPRGRAPAWDTRLDDLRPASRAATAHRQSSWRRSTANHERAFGVRAEDGGGTAPSRKARGRSLGQKRQLTAGAR
ncbi:hypothetical protein GCM10020219_102050 [Nonomuraea dietziae]